MRPSANGGARRNEAAIAREFGVEAADAAKSPPRLVGKFAQGPPEARFVYTYWGTSAGQFGSPWTRRAKIPLRGITATQIASVMKDPALLLEARIRGVAKGGAPACATVPLLSDWVATAKGR